MPTAHTIGVRSVRRFWTNAEGVHSRQPGKRGVSWDRVAERYSAAVVLPDRILERLRLACLLFYYETKASFAVARPGGIRV